MSETLKSSAQACKILAIAFSVVVPWAIGARYHSGMDPVADVQVVMLAVLSRTSFVIFLLLALFPCMSSSQIRFAETLDPLFS